MLESLTGEILVGRDTPTVGDIAEEIERVQGNGHIEWLMMQILKRRNCEYIDVSKWDEFHRKKYGHLFTHHVQLTKKCMSDYDVVSSSELVVESAIKLSHNLGLGRGLVNQLRYEFGCEFRLAASHLWVDGSHDDFSVDWVDGKVLWSERRIANLPDTLIINCSGELDPSQTEGARYPQRIDFSSEECGVLLRDKGGEGFARKYVICGIITATKRAQHNDKVQWEGFIRCVTNRLNSRLPWVRMPLSECMDDKAPAKQNFTEYEVWKELCAPERLDVIINMTFFYRDETSNNVEWFSTGDAKATTNDGFVVERVPRATQFVNAHIRLAMQKELRCEYQELNKLSIANEESVPVTRGCRYKTATNFRNEVREQYGTWDANPVSLRIGERDHKLKKCELKSCFESQQRGHEITTRSDSVSLIDIGPVDGDLAGPTMQAFRYTSAIRNDVTGVTLETWQHILPENTDTVAIQLSARTAIATDVVLNNGVKLAGPPRRHDTPTLVEVVFPRYLNPCELGIASTQIKNGIVFSLVGVLFTKRAPGSPDFSGSVISYEAYFNIRRGMTEVELSSTINVINGRWVSTRGTGNTWNIMDASSYDEWCLEQPHAAIVGTDWEGNQHTAILYYRNQRTQENEERAVSKVVVGAMRNYGGECDDAERYDMLKYLSYHLANSPVCRQELAIVGASDESSWNSTFNLSEVVKHLLSKEDCVGCRAITIDLLLSPETTRGMLTDHLNMMNRIITRRGRLKTSLRVPERIHKPPPIPPVVAVTISAAQREKQKKQLERTTDAAIEADRAKQAPALAAAIEARKAEEAVSAVKRKAAFEQAKAEEEARVEREAAVNADKKQAEKSKNASLLKAKSAEKKATKSANKTRKNGPSAFAIEEARRIAAEEERAAQEAAAAMLAAEQHIIRDRRIASDAKERANRETVRRATMEDEAAALEAIAVVEAVEAAEAAEAAEVAEVAEIAALLALKIDAAATVATSAPTVASHTFRSNRGGRGGRGGRGRGGRGRGGGRNCSSRLPLDAPPPPTEVPEEELCVVCWTNAKSHLCVPCGHHCLCATCLLITNPIVRGCPLCRAAVREVIKVYS